jgi:hypothetical protein
MKRLLTYLAVLILYVSSPCSGQETNYCHDPQAEAEWLALIAKYPGDYEIQALHALRIGLCTKVDQKMLTVQEATNIFEKARAALLRQRQLEQEQRHLESDKNL